MTVQTRKLKTLLLTLGGIQFRQRVSAWTLQNNTDDGDKLYVYADPDTDPDGAEAEFREITEPNWALQFTVFSDWTADGVSDYLMAHDGEVVAFQIDHHKDLAGEYVQIAGNLKIKAPNIGGDVRTTEAQQVTLQIIGKPSYVRP